MDPCFLLSRDADPSKHYAGVPVLTLHRVTRFIADQVAQRFGKEVQGKPYTVNQVTSVCDCRGKMEIGN